MPETITIRDCRKVMDAGEVFSFKCVSYNKQKKKGGKIKEVLEARLTKVRGVKSQESAQPATGNRQLETPKQPAHFKNYTRNIVVLINGHPTSEIMKIHPPLLIQFNGMKVTP